MAHVNRSVLTALLSALVGLALISPGHPQPPAAPEAPAASAITFRFSDRSADYAPDGPPLPITYGREPHTPPLAAVAPVIAKPQLQRFEWGLPRFRALAGLGGWSAFTFAGPETQRFLRIHPEHHIHLLGRRQGVDIDPQQYRWLAITWAVEQSPHGASMRRHRKTDRALVVHLALDSNTSPQGVPRTLAFFWGIDETIGHDYTGFYDAHSRRTILDDRPQVRFICLRNQRDGYGLFTDFVDLLAVYNSLAARLSWPNQMPFIRALGIESSNKHTQYPVVAQLHQLRFLSQLPTARPWESMLTRAIAADATK